MNHALEADDSEIDMTCDSERPVIMLVAGRTLDAERMRDYAIALGSSDLYPNARGYYLNIPRRVRILEGEPHADDVALMVRFPSECSAVSFWYHDFYQTEIKPMRLNPSPGTTWSRFITRPIYLPIWRARWVITPTHPSSL